MAISLGAAMKITNELSCGFDAKMDTRQRQIPKLVCVLLQSLCTLGQLLIAQRGEISRCPLVKLARIKGYPGYLM